MTTPYVEFDHVSKKFRKGERHDSLKDVLMTPFRRAKPGEVGEREFWSVRDLSFRVEPGDVLGVIGSNGAGKSTTLKLLTRILRPTEGRVRTVGRLGALIEVAAGFHPDLTGRENVYLQGAIMGMRRASIDRKFDEIVAFSGIEEFIDTPVKRYSSGMNARLGFSIAAHLDPDVLVIDEVLAVGDLSFQKRAFERLKNLASTGLPVVVVSHQLDRIRELCSSAILLQKGRTLAVGPTDEVLARYLEPAATDKASRLRIDYLDMAPNDGAQAPGTRIRLELRFTPAADWRMGEELIGIRVLNGAGMVVAGTGSDRVPIDIRPGVTSEEVLAFSANVAPGMYRIEVFVWDVHQARDVEVAASTTFFVQPSTPPAYGPVFLDFALERPGGSGASVPVRRQADGLDVVEPMLRHP